MATQPRREELPNTFKQKICILGGAGFIGSNLALEFIKDFKVTVVDDLFLGSYSNLWEISRFHSMDFEFVRQKAETFLLNRNDFDFLINCATKPLPFSLENKKESVENEFSIGTSVCEFARKNRQIPCIHFSTSEVYGEQQVIETSTFKPKTPYAVGKAFIDNLIYCYRHSFGVYNIGIVRPFNTFGPRQNFTEYSGVIPNTILRLYLDMPPLITGSGKQTREFVWVGDVVEKIKHVFREPPEIPELIVGEVYRVADLIDLVSMIYAEITNTKSKSPEFIEQRIADSEFLYKSDPVVRNQEQFKARIANTIQWYLWHFKKFSTNRITNLDEIKKLG